jgi:hypothetical protein
MTARRSKRKEMRSIFPPLSSIQSEKTTRHSGPKWPGVWLEISEMRKELGSDARHSESRKLISRPEEPLAVRLRSVRGDGRLFLGNRQAGKDLEVGLAGQEGLPLVLG